MSQRTSDALDESRGSLSLSEQEEKEGGGVRREGCSRENPSPNAPLHIREKIGPLEYAACGYLSLPPSLPPSSPSWSPAAWVGKCIRPSPPPPSSAKPPARFAPFSPPHWGREGGREGGQGYIGEAGSVSVMRRWLIVFHKEGGREGRREGGREGGREGTYRRST